MVDKTDRDKIWVDLCQLLITGESEFKLSRMSSSRKEIDDDDIEVVLDHAVEAGLLTKDDGSYPTYQSDVALFESMHWETRDAIETLLYS